MSPRERIVVVGGGLAGLSAAERLRERGWSGELVVVGDEPHLPYNRTPLSKQLLTGDLQPPQLRLRAYTELDATWRTGTPARQLELAERELLLPGGERLRFDGLVIATGAEARRLPGVPTHSPRVHTLRTLDDARAVAAVLRTARHLAVVGGGFIGCELAATARTRALDVTVVDRAPALLAGSLGPEIGELVTDLHRRNGVRLHLGATVTRWQDSGQQMLLHLADGQTVRADAVVVGVGAVPRTEWLAGAGLDTSDGVRCSATCHVLGPKGRPVAGIVAAGDVARWPNLRADEVPRRVEHWINAVEMGQYAAKALLSGPDGIGPFVPVPRFWSTQHGLRIQSVGFPALASGWRVLEGSLASRRFVVGYTRGHPETHRDVLVGAIGFDSPRALLSYRDLIAYPVLAADWLPRPRPTPDRPRGWAPAAAPTVQN